jgi:dTDP-4-dehydrorhamnose reductase
MYNLQLYVIHSLFLFRRPQLREHARRRVCRECPAINHYEHSPRMLSDCLGPVSLGDNRPRRASEHDVSKHQLNALFYGLENVYFCDLCEMLSKRSDVCESGDPHVKLLIFGIGGQLGQELAALCEQRGLNAILCARSQCDVTDIDQVVAVYRNARPSVVINAAAYTNVDRAEAEPELSYQVNRDGPKILAEVSSDRGVPLVHVSTDFVFDGSKAGAYLETDAVAPLGVYGLSKEAGEAEIRKRQDRHLIVRTGWVYGRFGRNFLKTMLDLSATRDGWSVVNDQVGTPTAASDLASALLIAAEKAFKNETKWGTYHFAGETEATWYDFAKGIVLVQSEFTARSPSVSPISSKDYPTAARRPLNSRLNSDLFATHFGARGGSWQDRVPEIVRALITH